LQEALAKLSAAQVALQDASKLAASRGSQVEALSAQLDALKASVANMSSQGQQAGAGTAAQLAQRDATIKVRASGCSVLKIGLNGMGGIRIHASCGSLYCTVVCFAYLLTSVLQGPTQRGQHFSSAIVVCFLLLMLAGDAAAA
jgi:hypothetical protein